MRSARIAVTAAGPNYHGSGMPARTATALKVTAATVLLNARLPCDMNNRGNGCMVDRPLSNRRYKVITVAVQVTARSEVCRTSCETELV